MTVEHFGILHKDLEGIAFDRNSQNTLLSELYGFTELNTSLRVIIWYILILIKTLRIAVLKMYLKLVWFKLLAQCHRAIFKKFTLSTTALNCIIKKNRESQTTWRWVHIFREENYQRCQQRLDLRKDNCCLISLIRT